LDYIVFRLHIFLLVYKLKEKYLDASSHINLRFRFCRQSTRIKGC